MDDIFTAHADRVNEANRAHGEALAAIIDKARTDVAQVIDEFRSALNAIGLATTQAAERAHNGVNEVLVKALSTMDEAFLLNTVTISASETAVKTAMSQRMEFFATGAVKEPPAMPNVADAPQLGAAAPQAPTEPASSDGAVQEHGEIMRAIEGGKFG